MARIRRWKEKLALACFTLLCWIPRAWGGKWCQGGRAKKIVNRLITWDVIRRQLETSG